MENVKVKAPKCNIKKKVITIFVIISLLTLGSISYSQDIIVNGENMTNDDYLKYMIETIKENYKYDVTEEELYNGIYKALFDSLDKHSVYFDPNEYKEFNISVSGEFGGIGITIELNEDGYIQVVSPIKGTPGHRAGISTGDVIKEVNGDDIKEWSLEKSLGIMRGEAGTEIILGIQKSGEVVIRDISIIREIIKINAVESEIVDGDTGVLTITSFNQNVAEDVNKVLNDFKENDIKALIIDLRNNPGGSLTEVLNISDFFVERGKELIYIDVKGEDDESYNSILTPILDEMPIVVLINESSASASEILAGVLQDYELATIIGMKSYGKGTVQNMYDLPNGSGIKMTIAEYLTPSHNKIDGVGIKPDIEIKDEYLLLKSKKNEIINFVPMIEKMEYRYLGETGLNIYGTQQRLSVLGYDVEIDGILGQATINAIKKFQLDYNLKSDGSLGEKTLLKLDEIARGSSKYVDNVLEKAIEILESEKLN